MPNQNFHLTEEVIWMSSETSQFNKRWSSCHVLTFLQVLCGCGKITWRSRGLSFFLWPLGSCFGFFILSKNRKLLRNKPIPSLDILPLNFGSMIFSLSVCCGCYLPTHEEEIQSNLHCIFLKLPYPASELEKKPWSASPGWYARITHYRRDLENKMTEHRLFHLALN